MAKDEIIAFLGAGASFEGRLEFQGAVRIDGRFRGEVASPGTLIVGQEGQVEGRITVGRLVVSGRICGELAATERAVLHKTARIEGSLVTPKLVSEEGAVVNAALAMDQAGAPEKG